MKDITDQIYDLIRKGSRDAAILPECSIEVLRHPTTSVITIIAIRADGEKRTYRVMVERLA